jgi:MATE family multidrug resistance protein
MFLLFRHSWAYLFNNDPGMLVLLPDWHFVVKLVSEVVTLVASILPLVALFQVFDGASAITAGILRARGKQANSVHRFSAYVGTNRFC